MNTHVIYSKYAAKAIAVGRKNHQRFRVIGCGEVPHEPYYKDEWWYEILKPNSILPPEGQRRLELLRKAGIGIKGTVIAHEAPRLLVAPKPEVKKEPEANTNINLDLAPFLEEFLVILGTILSVLGLILFRAVLLDPALIVVLEDDSWLEVMRWYEV